MNAPGPNAHREPGSQRVLVGLSKISLLLRSQAWQQAESLQLTPTQTQILGFIHSRNPEPVRVTDIAGALGITAQTASNAIGALLKKDLLHKQPHPRDARAVALSLTEQGARQARAAAHWPDFLMAAVEQLSLDEQDMLLRALVKLIRTLQQREQIPVSRMCTTCRYFRPGVHTNPHAPHHCDFVNAPFGDRHLRFDCLEYQAADPIVVEQLWAQFLEPTPTTGH